jgi:hypothetical protein
VHGNRIRVATDRQYVLGSRDRFLRRGEDASWASRATCESLER